MDTHIWNEPHETMFFKDRDMPIEREWIDGTDFLINDAQSILNMYFRSVIPQMRLLEVFGGEDIRLPWMYEGGGKME